MILDHDSEAIILSYGSEANMHRIHCEIYVYWHISTHLGDNDMKHSMIICKRMSTKSVDLRIVTL